MNSVVPIFIPSYHRADNCRTLHYYINHGYPADKIFVFVDDSADDIPQYEELCAKTGANLVVYSYEESVKRYDYVHRAFELRRSGGQCRNMFFDYARQHGIDFFMVQDDDTLRLELRQLGIRVLNGGDMTLEIICAFFSWAEDFMRRQHIGCFAFSQGGDFYGGMVSKKILRTKVMNTTFYLLPYVDRAERGVLDSDTSAYVNMYNEGYFTGSTAHGLILEQERSATARGGLTDVYNETKLLAKGLCCPIQFPSAIFAEKQEMNGGRLHHRIRYENLMPCIIRGKRGNIAWDTYPEDTPFSNEPRRTYDLHR